MRVLRRHVLLSLLDVSAVVATFFLCSSAGVVLSYAMKFLFSFWIPLCSVLRLSVIERKEGQIQLFYSRPSYRDHRSLLPPTQHGVVNRIPSLKGK